MLHEVACLHRLYVSKLFRLKVQAMTPCGIVQLSRDDILAEIIMLQKRIQKLRRSLRVNDEALVAKQPRCSHAVRMLVDCSGPRDNGEFFYRCRDCGDTM